MTRRPVDRPDLRELLAQVHASGADESALHEQLADCIRALAAFDRDTIAEPDGCLVWCGPVDASDAQDRDAFDTAVTQVVARVARAACGRTLGLFTSSRMARRAVDYLRTLNLPWPVLCQGEEPRPRLIERMRQGPSILCGTTSLWTGVDLPGEAVVAVVIDKIPFPAPGDPVRDALAERAEKRTGDKWASFREESVPTASLAMRQGVGRLIRSVADWGVVVVCDPRMQSKGYGRGITRALGMPRQVRTLGDVEMWFRERERAMQSTNIDVRGVK